MAKAPTTPVGGQPEPEKQFATGLSVPMSQAWQQLGLKNEEALEMLCQRHGMKTFIKLRGEVRECHIQTHDFKRLEILQKNQRKIDPSNPILPDPTKKKPSSRAL